MTGALCTRILFVGTLVAAVVMPLALPGETPPLPAPPLRPPKDQTPASPQTPVPAREAPGAIYKDAMQSLEQVRASLSNWSDPELAALSVGVERARKACDVATPEDYHGDDLYDLAHLCAFAQDWNPANDVALQYLASGESRIKFRP